MPLEYRVRDHDTIARWQRAEGANLESQAQRAIAKLAEVVPDIPAFCRELVTALDDEG